MSDLLELDRFVQTKLTKIIHDAARRYHHCEDGPDRRPVISIDAGATVTIDGVWEGGFLSASWQEHQFPVSLDEVEKGLYESLLRKVDQGDRPMLRCPNCDDGFRNDMEDGRPVSDACYTCHGSGKITTDTYFAIRVREFRDLMGGVMVANMKEAANSNPDGEGWAFAAAENGLNEYEYTSHHQMAQSDKVGKMLSRLEDEGFGPIIRTVVEKFCPFDTNLYLPTKGEQARLREKLVASPPPIDKPAKATAAATQPFPNLANMGTEARARCPGCTALIGYRDCEHKDGYFHCKLCGERLWEDAIPF